MTFSTSMRRNVCIRGSLEKRERIIVLLTSRFLFDKDERVLLEIDGVVDDDGERKLESRR